mmetsp:Transcript_72759/g.168653  ORF Transcript_72759/g.168653 Transcript_72759/m.168653 type:complete len:650 (+) Transcript_72759:66-2015(+)|eukprot:CAMPEP_0171066876 /NCGR_PEP_ID=MMETSP0766_2-20121228/7665_1 /TAXON_ID=439317 /ORGANISM="Gambierdiscus australes, Strain CAWD 149" /LENGTH=649 /DNA_ID=CAMNT_0011523067 /DNA_START=50 /DNA_END=1999 /DNA_ORIENTATION=+
MPTASSLLSKLREKSFRERLQDLASEHENLQDRYHALAADFETEKRELNAEIAQLRERAPEIKSLQPEVLQLRSKVEELTEELSRLRALADEREEQRLRAEARAAHAEARALALAKSESELAAAVEARVVAEARAKADADAKTQSDSQARREAAARAKEETGEAARNDEEALERKRLQTEADAADAADAAARAKASRRMVGASAEGDDGGTKALEEPKRPSEAIPSTEVQPRAEDSASPVAEARTEGVVPVKRVVRKARPNTENASQESENKKDSIAGRLPTVTALSSSPWIGSYRHSSTAKARLFVFYGAGSVGSSFGSWQSVVQKFYPEIELAVFEYPGHGNHVADFATDAHMFHQAFDQQVIQFHGLDWYFNCPFALIGMSTGACLGVSMLRSLQRLGVKPEKFYIIGRTPPLVPDAPSAAPGSTRAFLRWVASTILTTKKDAYEKLWNEMDQNELKQREHMWRSDLQLNSCPVAPLPRKWLVGEPGVLVKKPAADPSKMIRIYKDVGTPVFVTGEEHLGDRGDRWMQIDTSRADVKPGWYLINGRTVGINQDLLEPLEADDEPPNEQSLYWKAPVPFRVYHSTADVLHGWEDPTGRLRPMREWNRLTCFEPEFVEYEGLAHDELLMDIDVLHDICSDFVKFCRFR